MSKNVKILISCGQNFGSAFYKKFEKAGYQCRTCKDDAGVLISEIHDYSPDIVVCGVLMDGRNASAVIEHINGEDIKKPFFIVVSPYRNAFMEQEILSFENTYYLLSPYDADMIVSLVSRICAVNTEAPSESGDVSYEVTVTDILHQMGIPAHIKGYHYLREAIMLSLDNDDMLDSITKLLYPTVATRFSTTPSRVERAIRHAIETAWDRGDVDVLTQMFGYTVNVGKGKPTNSEFIALITDNLRLRFKITARSSKRRDKLNV